ncbi:hypothetical protein fugu_007303 [Takifugu bimaculatus]|uniref:Uncharacterized protein n=1 Tax=Takifugu bimaculatus TaxID=433685 RepID=A0A4Z2B3X6_9TELE|nr:hypothetical protein fugu_007303 [Takifugu bimaculatus]
MGEHNLLNPGFVGPLVNIHTGDTFYFPNFRPSGGQLPGLPSLSYPRRDNVCSLPWNPSEPCNGYSQSYFSSPVSINPSFNRSCEITRADDGKCYYNNGSGSRENCSGGGSLKREDRARDTSALTSDHGMHAGIGSTVAFSKYDYGTEQLTARSAVLSVDGVRLQFVPAKRGEQAFIQRHTDPGVTGKPHRHHNCKRSCSLVPNAHPDQKKTQAVF